MVFFDLRVVEMVVGLRKRSICLRALALVLSLTCWLERHYFLKLFVHLETFSFHMSYLVDLPFDTLLLLCFFLVSVYGVNFELWFHFICKLRLFPFALATCFLYCSSLDLPFFMNLQHIHLLFLHLVSQRNHIHLWLLVLCLQFNKWL